MSAGKGRNCLSKVGKDPVLVARRLAARRASYEAEATYIFSNLPPWACRLKPREGDATGFECTTCGWFTKSLSTICYSDPLCGCAAADARQEASALSRAQRVAIITDLATVAKNQRKEEATQRVREKNKLLARMRRQTLVC